MKNEKAILNLKTREFMRQLQLLVTIVMVMSFTFGEAQKKKPNILVIWGMM